MIILFMLTEGLISNLFQCNLSLDLKNSQSRVFIIQAFRFSEIISRVTKLLFLQINFLGKEKNLGK